MLIHNNKYLFNNLSKLIGIISFALTLILIIFFPDFKNPDWSSYKDLYNKADLYILYSKSSYLFLLLCSFLNNFLSYENFRILLVLTQLSIYYRLFKKSAYEISDLNIFICLPLIAFFILMVHIQLREGIALLIYLLTLLNFKNKKILSLRNFFFILLSFLIHQGILLLWVPSIIFIFKNKLLLYKKVFIYTFFFLIAIFSVNTYLRVSINDIFHNFYAPVRNFDEFKDLYLFKVNFQKICYWFSYLILFLMIYIEELKINSIALKNNTFNQISYIFGALSLNGLLVFLPTIFISSIFIDINGLDYNLIYRVSQLLFLLLIIYRSRIYPQRFLTLCLNTFFSVDTFRIIFF